MILFNLEAKAQEIFQSFTFFLLASGEIFLLDLFPVFISSFCNLFNSNKYNSNELFFFSQRVHAIEALIKKIEKGSKSERAESKVPRC